MDLKRYLKERKKAVDGYISKYISYKKRKKDCPKELSEAISYALTAGGKRVRPVLAIASYEAVGGKSGAILPVAAALELIHTYSLVHDDLPAMDNDDFRRNKPTTHKVFGEATAILAGDALLTDAFSIISHADAGPKTLLNVIKEISYAAGSEGMVGGQTADLVFEGRKAGKKDLLFIHKHKTGALIRGSVRAGALMGKATDKKLEALTEYGEKIGLAFQVVDDILDVTGTLEVLGKSAGADSARGKNTYPSTFGLEESRNMAERLVNDSLRALKGFRKESEPLLEIAKYILSRSN